MKHYLADTEAKSWVNVCFCIWVMVIANMGKLKGVHVLPECFHQGCLKENGNYNIISRTSVVLAVACCF